MRNTITRISASRWWWIWIRTRMPLLFYNLHGRSYSQVVQVEASYPFFPGFTFTAAYRWTDAKTNYNGELMEKTPYQQV